ncbi:MAG: hypothetical protein EU549_00795 [Promethearchaeota archaeon]|nr:MAG: hypothetical protein EU549_00795 [Candidatus Lokiarchaeota archaeon]
MKKEIRKSKVIVTIIVLLIIFGSFSTINSKPMKISSNNSDNVSEIESQPLISAYMDLNNSFLTEEIIKDAGEDDKAEDVVVDYSGNIYIVGSTDSFGANRDVWLLKYNSCGGLVWDKNWNGVFNDDDWGYGITLDHDGNVYIAGTTYTSQGRQMLLLKFNNSGDFEWSSEWGYDGSADIAYDLVIEEETKDLYLTGYTVGGGSGHDIVLVKFNQNGVYQWNKTFGRSDYDIGYGIAFDSAHYIYITGFLNATGENGQFGNSTLLKYDTQGNFIFNKDFKSANTVNGYDIAIDSKDSIYMTGTIDIAPSPPQDYEILLLKYNTTGHYQWNQTYGTPYGLNQPIDDYGLGITIDSNDDIFLAGYAEAKPSLLKNITLVKYSSLGIQQWNRTWDKNQINRGQGIAMDLKDNIYVAGYTGPLSGDNDLLCLKYVSNHDAYESWNSTWANYYNPYDLYDAQGDNVATDSNGNVYVVARTNVTTDNDRDLILMKYDNFGHLTWNRTLIKISSSGNYPAAIAVDSEDSVYIAATIWGTINYNISIMKYNSMGILLWNREWGGISNCMSYGVAVDSNNSVYISGRIDWDMLLLKYNSTGDYKWHDVLSFDSGTNEEPGQDVTVAAFDKIYITGWYGPASNKNISLAMYSSDGNQEWTKIWDKTNIDNAYGIAVDCQNNIYITGVSGSTTAQQDMILLKFNKTGDLKWERSWNSGSDLLDIGYDIDLDSQDFIYITGKTTYTFLPTNRENMTLFKYDVAGNLHWLKTWGIIDEKNYGNGIAVDKISDNIYVVGESYNFGLKPKEIFIRKYVQFSPEKFNLYSNAGIPTDSDGWWTLSWDTVKRADNYTILYSWKPITEINEDVTVVTSGIKINSATFHSAYNGNYYFMILASNRMGNSTSNAVLVSVKIVFEDDGDDDDDDEEEEKAIEIPGYDLFFVIAVMSIIMIFTARKKVRK